MHKKVRIFAQDGINGVSRAHMPYITPEHTSYTLMIKKQVGEELQHVTEFLLVGLGAGYCKVFIPKFTNSNKNVLGHKVDRSFII